MSLEKGFDDMGQLVGFGAVSQYVDDGNDEAVIDCTDEDGIPTDALSEAGPDEARMCQRTAHAYAHLRAVTRVPLPGSDSRVNSSIRRFTPGRPNPRVPPELK